MLMRAFQDLERYWDFVAALTDKLKDPKIRYYIGLQFKKLFEAHIKAFEVHARHSLSASQH